MDQTLSPVDCSPTTVPTGAAGPAPGPAASPAVPGDEDPESPGRSRSLDGKRPLETGSDPLGDAFAMLAGMTIAVMALLVPMVAVISDSRSQEPAAEVRASQ